MNPFAGLCKQADDFAKSESRWEERITIRRVLKRKDLDKYGLGFGWRVFTTRNKTRNILQVSVFYRNALAFHLLDIVPSVGAFAVQLSSTGVVKNGRYNCRLKAVKAGKLWLTENQTYAQGLRDEFLEE